MKKNIIYAVAVVVLLVVMSSMLVACSSSTTVSGKDYDKQVKFYGDINNNINKNSALLGDLTKKAEGNNFVAKFVSYRTYYPTCENTVEFLGTKENPGYDQNGDSSLEWLTQAIVYTINYDNGAVYIVADYRKAVASDKFEKTKLPESDHVESYLKNANGVEIGNNTLYDNTVGIMFGNLSKTEYIEKYAISFDAGFRIYTSMMQYETSRAFTYAEDGSVNYDNVIDYTQNKDKTKYSVAESQGKKFTDDDVTYWDEYGEDISYNFYKIAEVKNERVTMTYKKKTATVKTYEYFEERVLPYYTRKDDFNNVNVIKCRVADYTNWVMTLDYETKANVPNAI